MTQNRVKTLLRSDEGAARTKALASLVGVMMVAAVAALILVAFHNSNGNDNSSVAANQPTASDVGKNTSKTPSLAPVAAATSDAAKKADTAKKADPAKKADKVTKPKSATSTSGAGTSARKPITYIVKGGDNLTVIAAWFHQHGYGSLYEANKSVIGNNPDLIFPGQKITIAHGDMTVGS